MVTISMQNLLDGLAAFVRELSSEDERLKTGLIRGSLISVCREVRERQKTQFSFWITTPCAVLTENSQKCQMLNVVCSFYCSRKYWQWLYSKIFVLSSAMARLSSSLMGTNFNFLYTGVFLKTEDILSSSPN